MLTSLWVPPGSGSLGSDVKLFNDPNAALIPSRARRLRLQHRQQLRLHAGLQPVQRQPRRPGGRRGNGWLGTVTVGGLGHKGATRLVIFETDGMANEDSVPTSGITNAGASNSYYNIRPSDTVNGAGYNQNAAAPSGRGDLQPRRWYAGVLPNGYPTPPSVPGYATINKPVLVHCIAFGAVFETPNGARSRPAVALLAADLDDWEHYYQFVHRSHQWLQVVHRHVATT